MGKVIRYVLGRLSDVPVEGCHRIVDPWSWWNTGNGTINSYDFQGEDAWKTYYVTPIRTLEWTRANNFHFRYYHLVKCNDHHPEATLLLHFKQYETGLYSSSIIARWIIPYLDSLPKYCHRVNHNCAVLSNPGYVERFDQFTALFEECANTPDTVVIVKLE